MDDKNISASFYEHKYRDIMDFFQNLFKQNYAYGTELFHFLYNCNFIQLYWDRFSSI